MSIYQKMQSFYPVVDGIAFDEVVFEDFVSPNAELSTSFTFNTITNWDDYVERIKSHMLLYVINTQKMRVVLFY